VSIRIRPIYGTDPLSQGNYWTTLAAYSFRSFLRETSESPGRCFEPVVPGRLSAAQICALSPSTPICRLQYVDRGARRRAFEVRRKSTTGMAYGPDRMVLHANTGEHIR
jgi:hypothetical protein